MGSISAPACPSAPRTARAPPPLRTRWTSIQALQIQRPRGRKLHHSLLSTKEQRTKRRRKCLHHRMWLI
jgi:hypothetical protein